MVTVIVPMTAMPNANASAAVASRLVTHFEVIGFSEPMWVSFSGLRTK